MPSTPPPATPPPAGGAPPRAGTTPAGATPPGSRLPALVQTALFVASPVRFLERAQRRYGPVFRTSFLGFPNEVFVTTADLAEQVYALDAGGARAGAVRQQFIGPMVGEHSLLSLDGEPWRRHRRLLTPPLHGNAIARYRTEIAEIAATEIARWPRDQPFALRERMQDITLEVMLRLVFGIRDAERLQRLRVLIPKLVDLAGSIGLLMLPPRVRVWAHESPVLRRMSFLPTTRLLNAREAVDTILFDEIARRRARPVPGATDVLSRLLDARDEDGQPMTDQELRDELITMLEAGHETTATGLAWTFERLVRTPEVLRTLRGELDSGRDDTYLDAVIKEALRSRPVVYEVPRLLDAPVRLAGYEIPAGWYAAPLISLIHRDPDAFPEPDEFRPERFLEPDAARAQKAWMPFGGGRRYCVGAQLALLEMRVIIRELLRRLDVTAPGTAPEAQRMRHVTLVPARDGRIVVRSRPPEDADRPRVTPGTR